MSVDDSSAFDELLVELARLHLFIPPSTLQSLRLTSKVAVQQFVRSHSFEEIGAIPKFLKRVWEIELLQSHVGFGKD